MTTMIVESISSLYFFMPFSFGSQGQEALVSSHFHFADEVLCLGDHRMIAMRETGGLTELGTGRARQEGLEPPTGGFGDRYSTN